MPGRTTLLVNNEIYHIFNRGVASQPIFLDKRDYQRALETLFFYQNSNLPVKYSRFLTLSLEERASLLEKLRKQKNFLVDILAYCLMPNHFHLLVKQLNDAGISKFVGNLTNSYTRFFNIKRERSGPILEGKFKSVRIETDNQLLHVSRYIHLNPYTAYIVKNLEELENYPYSSFVEYLKQIDVNLCAKDIILSNFRSTDTYRQFVFDQADYQRTLDQIKHLILD